VRETLTWADGVMLGRAAYHMPDLLGRVDAEVFGEGETVDGFEAVERYKPYLARKLAEGVPLAQMTRHMLGLFTGRPGARAWRRLLTVEGVRPGAGLGVLDRALCAVARTPQAETA
jgi:tRNA-dihydrouridine synthase A